MDMLILGLRVVLSLAAVLGLVWVLQRRFRSGAAGAAASPVSVIGRRGIGAKASVVVVEAEGKRFVLGVTESSVNVLHASDAAPAPAPAPARADAAGTPAPTNAAGAAGAAVDGPGGFERELQEATAARSDLLAGSVLSARTWKQAGSAIRNGLAK